jgi:endonuclease YncB( thermonuclease family)
MLFEMHQAHIAFRLAPARWAVWRAWSRMVWMCFLLWLAPAGAQHQMLPEAEQGWWGVVTWVSDGDTVWVRDGAGATHKVRLLGMDAPEICQAHGQLAKEALEQLLLGHNVKVHGQRYDDYGRLLARLDVGASALGATGAPAKDAGRWMVQQGHAWSYTFRQDPGPYAQEEQRAREARLGLFASGQAQRPRDFRRQHGPCHEPWVPHS